MMPRLVLVVGFVGVVTFPVCAQDAKLVQAGKEVYALKECARCHMVAGRGYRHGKLDGVATKVSPEDMRKWLTTPREMEAMLDEKPKVRMSSRKRMTLTDADVTALVAYLRTLK